MYKLYSALLCRGLYDTCVNMHVCDYVHMHNSLLYILSCLCKYGSVSDYKHISNYFVNFVENLCFILCYTSTWFLLFSVVTIMP